MYLETSTNSISGKIESIIREAKSELYLVSPFIRLSDWKPILNAIEFAVNRGVKIIFIAKREKIDKVLEELEHFLGKGCKLYFLENLHTKLYYNKAECLITSMNLYTFSAENNYELGVVIQKNDTDELEKLDTYIQFLRETSELYQTKQVVEKEKKELEKVPQGETRSVEFRVISKGYKWFKVETPEGYENKVLIQDAPTLKVENRYIAKAKVSFSKTPYGFNVTYSQIHDVEPIEGYCLHCRKVVEKKYLLCFPCNDQKKKGGEVKLQYCHSCGEVKAGISLEKPVCKPCYIQARSVKE